MTIVGLVVLIAVMAIFCTLIFAGWYFLGITRLLAIGIVLLGVAAAIGGELAAMTWDGKQWHPQDAGAEAVAVCCFMIVVIGLSGLVCAAFGLVQLLARRKGT